MAKEEAIQVQGKVTQALANTQFRVKLDNGYEIIAHIAGRMRKNFIRHSYSSRRYRDGGNLPLRFDQRPNHLPRPAHEGPGRGHQPRAILAPFSRGGLPRVAGMFGFHFTNSNTLHKLGSSQ